jgi:hypothetical protein
MAGREEEVGNSKLIRGEAHAKRERRGGEEEEKKAFKWLWHILSLASENQLQVEKSASSI